MASPFMISRAGTAADTASPPNGSAPQRVGQQSASPRQVRSKSLAQSFPFTLEVGPTESDQQMTVPYKWKPESYDPPSPGTTDDRLDPGVRCLK